MTAALGPTFSVREAEGPGIATRLLVLQTAVFCFITSQVSENSFIAEQIFPASNRILARQLSASHPNLTLILRVGSHLQCKLISCINIKQNIQVTFSNSSCACYTERRATDSIQWKVLSAVSKRITMIGPSIMKKNTGPLANQAN